MFGGVGLFMGDTMFGLIAGDELFFKVDDANRGDYEAAGEAPFSYATKHGTHTLHSYWHCPPDLLDQADTLRAWARNAMAAAVRTARAKSKAKPVAGRKRAAPP